MKRLFGFFVGVAVAIGGSAALAAAPDFFAPAAEITPVGAGIQIVVETPSNVVPQWNGVLLDVGLSDLPASP